MSDTQHTPGPFRGFYGKDGELLAIVNDVEASLIAPEIDVDGGTGAMRARLSSEHSELQGLEGWEADIAFVLSALNCHDDLLAALEGLGAMPEGYCFCAQLRNPLKNEECHTGECSAARAAIAKAKDVPGAD